MAKVITAISVERGGIVSTSLLGRNKKRDRRGDIHIDSRQSKRGQNGLRPYLFYNIEQKHERGVGMK